IGPCTLRILAGTFEHTARCPYPVQGAQVKCNFDKKKRQIRLVMPVYQALEGAGYPFDPFPVLQHAEYTPWNIHHIYVDRMPKLDLRNAIRNPEKHRWISRHIVTQTSDREKFVQHCTNPAKRHPSEVLANIKDVIATLVYVYAGIKQASRSIFVFREPSHGIFMAICVAGLRLDLAGATVVLDAAFVPWSSEVAKLLDSHIPVHEVEIQAGDVPSWHRLSVAFVERCRTWTHEPNCEYKSTGNAPLSVHIEKNPLCTCGQGVGFESPDWKTAAWHVILPHGTRAAISPLFGVSYLERQFGPGSKLQDAKQPISWHEPTNKCWHCGGTGKSLMGCQKCKKARYCSKDCQGKHWKAEHKHVCKPPGH
ncbi:hypothetical protein FRC09_013810, partial [Ceratobasidium sp. 395]